MTTAKSVVPDFDLPKLREYSGRLQMRTRRQCRIRKGVRTRPSGAPARRDSVADSRGKTLVPTTLAWNQRTTLKQHQQADRIRAE